MILSFKGSAAPLTAWHSLQDPTAASRLPGGEYDDLGPGWSDPDFYSRVAIFSQFASQELVQLSFEDAISDKLQSNEAKSTSGSSTQPQARVFCLNLGQIHPRAGPQPGSSSPHAEIRRKIKPSALKTPGPAPLPPLSTPPASRRHLPHGASAPHPPPSAAILPHPPPSPAADESRDLPHRGPADMEAPRGLGDAGGRPHLALLGDLHRHLAPRRPAERRERALLGGLYRLPPLPIGQLRSRGGATRGRGMMGNVVFSRRRHVGGA